LIESALKGDRFKQKEVEPDFAMALQDLVINHFLEWKSHMEKAKKVKIDFNNLKLTFDIKTKDIREENEKIKSELASYKDSSFNFAIYKNNKEREITTLSRKVERANENENDLLKELSVIKLQYQSALKEIASHKEYDLELIQKAKNEEIKKIKVQFEVFLNNFSKYMVFIDEIMPIEDLKSVYNQNLLDLPQCANIMTCIIEIEKNLRFLKQEKYAVKELISVGKEKNKKRN